MVNSSTGVVSTAALTNGQLLIGSTGAAAVAAAITAGAGIAVTNGAGSISIAASGTPAGNRVTKTANFTFSSTDNIVWIDASTGPITGTLLAASTITNGGGHRIKRIDKTVNQVTIVRAGSDTLGIYNDTSMILESGVALELISDGGTHYEDH
jgi:hypothetical protein